MHNSFTHDLPPSSVYRLYRTMARGQIVWFVNVNASVSHQYHDLQHGNLNEQAASLYVSRLGQNLVPGC